MINCKELNETDRFEAIRKTLHTIQFTTIPSCISKGTDNQFMTWWNADVDAASYRTAAFFYNDP